MSQSHQEYSKSMKAIKGLAFLFLGIVIPFFLMYQAQKENEENVQSIRIGAIDLNKLNTEFASLAPKLTEANHFALYSMMFNENVAHKTFQNKQLMKSNVVLIGFSVISIGMMFIVLGLESGTHHMKPHVSKLDDKGAGDTKALANQQNEQPVIDTTVTSGDLSINIKTASTGLATIIIGSAMAIFGGVVPNEYKGGPRPDFSPTVASINSVSPSMWSHLKSRQKTSNPPAKAQTDLVEPQEFLRSVSEICSKFHNETGRRSESACINRFNQLVSHELTELSKEKESKKDVKK